MLSIHLYAQHITIRGQVVDKNTNEELVYSTCYDSISCKGTTSNSSGVFNFKAKLQQKVSINISHIGYFTQKITFLAL